VKKAGMMKSKKRFSRKSARPELILIFLLVLVIAAACSGGETEPVDTELTEVSGPALIMFYTDN
jgi:hypothetical protein